MEKEKTLAEIEREHIVKVVTSTDFNIARSARILGIDRRTLYRRCAEYGLKRVVGFASDGSRRIVEACDV